MDPKEVEKIARKYGGREVQLYNRDIKRYSAQFNAFYRKVEHALKSAAKSKLVFKEESIECLV